MGARSKKTAEIGEDAETAFARECWLERKREGMAAKDWARRVGVSRAAVSQVESGTHGIGGSITGWAKALGYRSVEDFRVAAYRWYLARYELRPRRPAETVKAPESGTSRAAAAR